MEHVHACAGEAEQENPIKAPRTCDMINDSGQFSPSALRQTLLQIKSRYAHRLRVAFSPSHTLVYSYLCGDFHSPNPPADPDLDPVSNTHPMLISPSCTEMWD